MKAHHRKTHWIHLAFSLVVLGALAALLLIRRDTSAVILASAFGIYVAGNTYIHLKRGDFKPDTVVEYVLLAFAVFIVLASAI